MLYENPGSALKKIYNGHKMAVIAFVSTIICGYITHIYMLTNKLYNYFEMGNIFSTMPITKGDTLAMGRVFLPFVTRISTCYSSAIINGLLCFLMIGAAAYMIVDMLNIKHMIYAVLSGAVLITFPGVASYLSYGINTDVFCGAFVLAVLSVYITKKYKFGWIFGIVALGVSLGTYQPFLSVAIAVVFLLLFQQVLEEEISWKQLILLSCKYLIMMIAAFVFYYISLQIALKITGIEMGNYHGVNEMTSFSVKGILKGLVYTYFYFLYYFFSKIYNYFSTSIVFHIVATVMLIVFVIRLFINGGKEYATKVRICQVIVLICFIPLGMNASPFLMADRVGNGVDRYMMFSIMLTYVLLMKITDLVQERHICKRIRIENLALWTSILAVVVTIGSNYYICNMAYHRMDAVTQSVDKYLNRMAGRLEQMDEWQEGTAVYFANCEDIFSEYYNVEQLEFDSLQKIDGTELKPWYSYGALVKYMNEYLHFPLGEVSEEQMEAIEESAELAKMPVYPAEGSIAQIHGVLVVKISSQE